MPWRPSKRFAVGLWGGHALLAGLVISTGFVWWVALVLVGVIAIHAGWRLRAEHRLQCVESVHAAGEGWYLTIKGVTHSAHVWWPPLVLHFLVILYLRSGKRRYVLPVLADSTTPEAFHALRVHLNIHR